ncbi:hypothetical protein SAY86_028520 [Trapa natans]|uniref:Macrophage migration inhibitory factor n=1 Tax=Trapa natans TaxID=22666 RepID=A0AAN7M0S3_TRANT|nr:hypothetical protein SAY86_028520 [Trapa natans]
MNGDGTPGSLGEPEIREQPDGKMPCLYISTNVCLDGVDTEPIFVQATKAVSSIIGRPENFVMVIMKGSLAISFGGNKDPAVYAEIVAMGGITREVKRQLISTLGSILHDNLSVPPARFFLKVFDTTAHRSYSKL